MFLYVDKSELNVYLTDVIGIASYNVFAPMIAIQIADYFILKADSKEDKKLGIANIIIWVIGFILYRLLMRVDIIVGNTLPDMIITVVICVVTGKLILRKKN